MTVMPMTRHTAPTTPPVPPGSVVARSHLTALPGTIGLRDIDAMDLGTVVRLGEFITILPTRRAIRLIALQPTTSGGPAWFARDTMKSRAHSPPATSK